MRNVNLEENELTITAIFQQHTKGETIQTLKEALEVLEQEESDPENDEMIEIINSTVGKLQQIEYKYNYSLFLNYLELSSVSKCGHHSFTQHSSHNGRCALQTFLPCQIQR